MPDEKYLIPKAHEDAIEKIFLDYMKEMILRDKIVLKHHLLPLLYDQFNRPITNEFTITGRSITSPLLYKEE